MFSLLAVGFSLALPSSATAISAIASAVVGFLLRHVTMPGGTTAPATGLPTNIDLTHLPADLGAFTGLIKAAASGDTATVASEMTYWAGRVRDLGTIEAAVEDAAFGLMEKRLAGGNATPVLSRIAKALKIDERSLLTALEAAGKATAALIVFAVLICSCGTSQAADMTPQRFSPTEQLSLIDSPQFTRPAPAGAMQPTANVSVAPMRVSHDAGNYRPVGGPITRVATAPARFVFRFRPVRRFFGFVFRGRC